MSRGERGGTTPDLPTAEVLHDQYKTDWRNRIKWRIVQALVETGGFHATDLVDLRVPEDCKNVIGSSIGAAVRKGFMVETGERRASKDAAGHGRRSAVYRINPDKAFELRERWDRHQPEPEPLVLFEAPTRPGHLDVDAA